jgi:hypothetical protein
LQILTDEAADEVIVKRLRELFELPGDEPIEPGELHIAGMLREIRGMDGTIDFDLDEFAKHYKKAKANGHGVKV